MVRWRRTLAAPGIDAARFADEVLSATFEADATCLKSEASTWVYRGTIRPIQPPRIEIVAKMWILAGAWQVLKSRLGLSQAQRHWRAAQLLIARGIPTARPLLLIRGHRHALPSEILVMEALPGPTLLEAIARRSLPVRTQHELARSAGLLVRRLVDAGLFNRDNKPSNIIVTQAGSEPAYGRGRAQLALIDVVGVRRIRRPENRLARMLASLAIEPMGCGVPVRRTLMMRAVLASAGHRSRARRLWREAQAIIEHHGDPAPRTNPLAGSSLNCRDD